MPAFPVVRTLADVEEIERTPLSQRLVADSTYEVLCRAAREHGDSPALRFVATAAPRLVGPCAEHGTQPSGQPGR
jgi:hypothetical protein